VVTGIRCGREHSGEDLAVNGLHSEARPRVDVRIVGRRTAGGITNGFGTDSATTGIAPTAPRCAKHDDAERGSDGNWRNG
jgi:hypothetical protein